MRLWPRTLKCDESVQRLNAIAAYAARRERQVATTLDHPHHLARYEERARLFGARGNDSVG